MKRALRLWIAFGLCWPLLACSGCAAPTMKPTQNQAAAKWDKAQDAALRQNLADYQNKFQSLLEGSADAIRNATPSRAVRKMAALWKVRMNTMVSDAMAEQDPVTALLETWSVCLRVRDYFQSGDGAKLFLDQQGRAVKTVAEMINGIEAVAGHYLPPEEMDGVRQRLAAYATSHPLTGEFEQNNAEPFRLDKAVWEGVAGIIGLPLLPLAVPGAIAQGAKDVTTVADRWADVAEDLPRELRWQMELFLTNLEDYESFERSLKTAEAISQSAERISKVADDLNSQLTQKTRQVVDPAEARLTSLIDHATWRVTQLLILAFSLGVVLILLSRRRKRAEA